LLIAFVENAFKHGVGAIENCYVHIDIAIDHGKLQLKITNSIPEKKRDVISTKIGLKNTKERLKILYPGDYNLDIKETSKSYTVDLKLKLKKHTV